MLAGMSLGTDLKRYSRGTMPRLALVTIVVLPLLYGAMYLWAFWNPFAEIDKVPVALVNEDRGATVQGHRLNVGEQVAETLVASRELDLHQVSADDAASGVGAGIYYFSITLPAEFSSAIASPSGDHPEQAQIEFSFNDANNYLASIMGQNAAREVVSQVSAKVGEQILTTALTGATDAGIGVKDAASGAGELSAGLDAANDGAHELADGAQELSTNLVTARDGSAELAAGTRQLSAGITRVTDALTNAVSGIGDLRGDVEQLEADLADPSSQIRVFLAHVMDGGLKSDLTTLRSGVTELDAGAHELNSGLVQLTDGSVQLADGAAELADGTEQLAGGAAQLADGLSEGVDQVPTWTPKHRAEVARVLADPVAVNTNFTNQATTFGTGFAPFFLPLALFIGALIIWMLLTPLQPRAIVTGLGALRVVLASYWPALLLGIGQVVLMYVVVHFGVGLQAAYAAGTVAFLALVAAAFLALIQAFNAVLGVAVGRVFTLAFLMFQLVSSGGVYPVETTAKPFQILHPYDPMTYAVDGLRQLTVGGIDSRLWISVGVLAAILVASLAASAWSARRDRQYTLERLYPPIEV